MKNILLFLLAFLTIQGSSIAQGTWTTKANFPGAGRELPAYFSMGNKAYISCGYTKSIYVNDLWCYDPSTNAWTQLANLPAAGRYGPVGFSIGNKGYVGTGRGSGY